ncbi:hypothetical protein GCM10009007_09860 [Formosimonas limnophila]|uniref:DNA helicase n=1 Tax=Formosimonas limnophila TaxID=1384487 RepID=A0A8J3CMX0_9BURK|nr:UvrD-helicase domain-containing protein [Formosimonas limnophila]GHA71032.1 hypothetical protein GCM10009007_09860 [Formosimonas limnophila]
MKNKLMIAGAGAGKTHFLVQESLKYPNEKILITTYTQENERSITQRFISLNGCVPKHVTIQTWFSFLLQHGVRPFQGSFNDKLFDIEINGLIINNGREYGSFKNKVGVSFPYPENTDFMRHYFVGKTKILSDRLSKFVFKSNEKTKGAVISRISKIFTHIYVDEVQDLAGYDLALLKLFFESSSKVLLVGDPRQTTFETHYESKHKNYRNGKIKDFLNTEIEVKKTPFEIDEQTLSASHRSNQAICDFSSQLYSNDFEATQPCRCCPNTGIDHQGIFTVNKKNVTQYLEQFKPVQLRWNLKQGVNENFQFCNFGASKGQTYERVLIYPTPKMLNWLKNGENLEGKAKAKLYVAITRAKYSVAFVMDSKIANIQQY